uniref:VWFD domain-containing protein n=1 Tax=Ciona savignyi TaxID=51511 RepID=H2ZP85_CIOSA
CSSWGMNHYTTYDGKHFYFPGKCSYSMTYECSGTFRVVNDYDCSTSCKRAVVIELGPLHQVSLFPNSTATHNGRFIKMPKTVDNTLSFERIGVYTVVRLLTGVRIFFDNDVSVYVAVPDSLMNEMCGLCGDYDGIMENDFVINKEKEFTNVNAFGNYYHVVSPSRSCTPVPLDVAHPCHGYSNSRLSLVENRCRLLLSEAFRACHHVIDPKEYVQRCMMDVCSCDGDTQCACATFTHYSRACAYMGVVLSWRNSDTCGVVCDGGKIYSECGSACPVTCENPDMTQECSSNVCVDGCHCPIGRYIDCTVYDTTTNTCVTRDNCPCTKAGDVYQHGDVIKQDCNNCTCSGGRWNCTDAPCPALCSVIGEDHYVTFDGRRYQFAGGCEYVLVQTKPNDVRPFAVWVQNRGCGFYDDDSCKKSISLKIAGSAVYQMTSNGHVTMGNKELVLPHRDSTLTFHRLSSSFLRMTSSEVEVTWDGAHRIYVKVPPRMKNRLEGLCGVYNLNQADDYRTPTSAITINVAEFGNSWKTDISCSSNQVSTGISVDACVIATSYLTHANVMCSVLKLGAFESCNNLVDPSPYVTMCQHDVCHCLHKFNADAQSCRCTVLSAYARACALAGRAIQSSWRDTTSCPVTCTQGRVWDECNNDNCDVTCQMISNANQCNAVRECVEGCRCPVGQVFDESIDYCVNKSDCSCYYRNAVYTHGSSREAMCATCRCDGGLWKCESTAGCTRESMCQDVRMLVGLLRFILICICAGQSWSNCTECQRTCDNMHTSCVQLECHEGCSCPNGTVLSDGKCVTPDHCPCHYRGKSYRDGSWVKQDCNFCRCRNTNWECTERECPAYCSAYGDPHYETFDKRRYEFHGDCTYVLAEDYCGDGVGSFKVTVENVPCSTGGVTCTKAVKV